MLMPVFVVKETGVLLQDVAQLPCETREDAEHQARAQADDEDL